MKNKYKNVTTLKSDFFKYICGCFIDERAFLFEGEMLSNVENSN